MKSNGTDRMNERERDEKCYVAYPTNALETAVLIVVCSVNIHQDDYCHFLDPHASTRLTTGRTYPSQIITLR